MTVIAISLLWILSALPQIATMGSGDALVRTVALVVETPAHTPRELTKAFVAEAAAIWRPRGIVVQASLAARDASERTLRVVVTDDARETRQPDEPLGWIRFQGCEPDPVIYLSTRTGLDILDSTATLRSRPAAYRDVLMARVLGRALAHELGHYLFCSKQHATHGLMQAHLSTDALVASTVPVLEWRP